MTFNGLPVLAVLLVVLGAELDLDEFVVLCCGDGVVPHPASHNEAAPNASHGVILLFTMLPSFDKTSQNR